MAPKVAAKAAKVEISLVTGKPKRIRRDNGREAAKLAATMTKEEWKEWQTPEHAAKWPKPAYMAETPEVHYVRDGGEGAYRDKTYEIVTRWTEKTEIVYRPYAKAPGSKSHIRYNNYATATTIGEALQLGSYPLDWCFDYEHGFIRVTGGEIRDEPIDPTRVPDLKQLTAVDNCIMQWYRRELAKKYGLKVQDLLLEKDGEPLMMRCHRLVANRYAEEYLAAAAKEGRLIHEHEVLSVLETWGFARNTTRVNVMGEGKDFVWSDTLGLLRDRAGDIHLTRPTVRYPAVVKLLSQYLRDRIPEEAAAFKFTSLNLNKNYAAVRHRDGNNFGPSMIKGFGDYQRGELCVFPGDDRSLQLDQLPIEDRVTVDIKKNLVMFNGNSAHEVEEYEGNRYSVVYFTIGCHAKASDECKAALSELCMPVPAPDEDPAQILSAPTGYQKPVARPGMKTSGASLAKGGKPLRWWPIASLDQKGKRGSWSSTTTTTVIKKQLSKRSVQTKLVVKKPAQK